MSRALLSVLALVLTVSLAVSAEQATVTRVVDGDTLVVAIAGHEERVRLIGVDTPETVHPQKPVEYFGKEASAFTTRMAEGAVVQLETDPGTADRDKYNRLLRYVYLPDGKLLNAEIIAQGYGFAYTKYPFSKMEEFRLLEREARESGKGLWGETSAEGVGER
jgi:micrococcal nuclease